MADNYDQVTAGPFIPKSLVGRKEIELIGRYGFSSEEVKEEDALYFFAEEYCSCPMGDSGEEYEESDLIELFQRIIKRSKGKLPYIWLHGAGTCSKMRPDEFGGWAIFITESGYEAMNTWEWIREKKEALSRKPGSSTEVSEMILNKRGGEAGKEKT